MGVDTVSVSSPAGLGMFDVLSAGPAGSAAPGVEVRVGRDGWSLDLSVSGDGGVSEDRFEAVRFESAEPGASVYVDGHAYRGVVEVRAVADGKLTAVNVLSMEEYLLGVVPLEIGPRDDPEAAAVEAQAVAARTYAVAHLRSHPEMGFDLYGTVEDQAYGGLQAERPESTRAVETTRGQILVFEDRPIRAFYHSTCGGRTAAVEEVLDRDPAPYLRSVSDTGPDGIDYCSVSPRYRWKATFTTEELNGRVRDALGRRFRVAPAAIGPIDRLEVIDHSESGRVFEVAFRGPGAALVASRLDIRLALPDEDGRILGSTDFVLTQGNGLVELQGRGYGHGAGMCQWGAIGRARAGHTFEEILAAYYPGAELVRVY